MLLLLQFRLSGLWLLDSSSGCLGPVQALLASAVCSPGATEQVREWPGAVRGQADQRQRSLYPVSRN